MIARLRRRLAGEDGIALVFALMILTVLVVMTATMITFTTSTQHDSSYNQARQKAYSLAEAGMGQGLAQLASHYYDSSQTANNNSTMFSTSWFGGVLSAQQQSPSSSSACTTTSTCMSWSLVSCSFTLAVTGCSLATGLPSTTMGTITLKGTGSVPSPIQGVSAVTRAVTAKVDVTKPVQLVQSPSYWTEIYAGAPPSSGCDLSLGQGVTITAPLYVAGNLCLTSSAQVYGSTVNLKVFGWTWLRNSSTIGSSSGSPARVNTAQIAGGCSSSNNTQPTQSSGCLINKNGDAIWDSTPTSQHSPTSPTADTLPTIDWTAMSALQAGAVPAPSCTNGRSLSEATFALTPTSSYSCTSGIGSITYTYVAGGTSTLAISGDVYFSGNLSIDTSSSLVQYTGIGSFFVAGSVVTANNSYLCVKIASGNCDFANANNSASSGYWDVTQNLLLLQSRGSFSGTNIRFQGGIYSATSIATSGGQGTTQGPLVTPGALSIGQQLNGSFPAASLIQSGSLGTPAPPYKLTPPYGLNY